MKEYEIFLTRNVGTRREEKKRVIIKGAPSWEMAKEFALTLYPDWSLLKFVSPEKFKEMARARGLPVDWEPPADW
jgi:hypothetical protein